MTRANESDGNLTIKLPKGSAIEANLVSADLRTKGVNGMQHLRTVSGDVSGTAGGELALLMGGTVGADSKVAIAREHGCHEVIVYSREGVVVDGGLQRCAEPHRTAGGR